MTRRLIPAAAVIATTIAAIAVPAPSTAQDDMTESWIRHLCPDNATGQNIPMIGFQPPAEFEELTYWRGYASLAKDIVNLWSRPSEVVVYSYPMSTFNMISVDDPSAAFRRAAISTWLTNPGKLAIVNVTQDMNYVGTPVQWSGELAGIVRDAAYEFDGTAGLERQEHARPDIADIALQLGFASGILDDTLAAVAADMDTTGTTRAEEGDGWIFNFNGNPTLSLNARPDSERNCESATISNYDVYQAMKNVWLEQPNYLATTEPIPGLIAEDQLQFIVPRNIWPER